MLNPTIYMSTIESDCGIMEVSKEKFGDGG